MRAQESRGTGDADARQVRQDVNRLRAQDSRATEDDDSRQVRQEVDRLRAQETRGTEDDDSRQVRQEVDRLKSQERCATEDDDSRQARLQENRLRMHSRRDAQRCQETAGPLLHQPAVKSKVAAFHAKLGECEFTECGTCNESFPSITLSRSEECVRCSRDKRQPKLYSRENSMDPGPVPVKLQGLTQVEEMLISAVMPMMMLYRLPHGQYGYRGHIINLPQDISSSKVILKLSL